LLKLKERDEAMGVWRREEEEGGGGGGVGGERWGLVTEIVSHSQVVQSGDPLSILRS